MKYRVILNIATGYRFLLSTRRNVPKGYQDDTERFTDPETGDLMESVMRLPKYQTKRKKGEEKDHTKIFIYLRDYHPDLLVYGNFLAGARLHPSVARRAKQMGNTRKFPDIMIYNPKRGFVGLAIEIKKTGEKLKTKKGTWVKGSNDHIQNQAEMLKLFQEYGWAADFAVGFAEAKRLIDWYVGLIELSNYKSHVI